MHFKFEASTKGIAIVNALQSRVVPCSVLYTQKHKPQVKTTADNIIILKYYSCKAELQQPKKMRLKSTKKTNN